MVMSRSYGANLEDTSGFSAQWLGEYNKGTRRFEYLITAGRPPKRVFRRYYASRPFEGLSPSGRLDIPTTSKGR